MSTTLNFVSFGQMVISPFPVNLGPRPTSYFSPTSAYFTTTSAYFASTSAYFTPTSLILQSYFSRKAEVELVSAEVGVKYE